MPSTTKSAAHPAMRPERNSSLYDSWSLVHLATGIVMGWLISPFAAIIIMALWEPFEILMLSPLLARHGISFGHETLRNSLSDIVFDILGVAAGYYWLTSLVEPPFRLF